jgi:uncharacterized protein (DUF697 family)
MSYMDTLRRVMEGGYDDASDEERTQAVQDMIQGCSVAAGAVSFQPIPFVDTVLISPIQIGMVQAIGRIHGHKLDQKAVLEMLSTFGASLLAQNAIMAAAKFIPFLGWALSIAMAYALTHAIGEVSDFYFRNGRGVDSEELRSMFKRVYKEKRDEKTAQHKGDASLKDRLTQLKEAYEADILTKEEFEKKKAELLANF